VQANGQAVDTTRVYEIQEVTVSADRIRREVIPVQRLDGKTLERLGNQSVADALRYFSGIQIKDYGGIGGLKTVNVRSMGTNHMGVFFDGIQLGNAQNGQIDLGKFSLDNMEEVSLYNGQRSNIFQSAKDFASSGALYLTSARPRFDDSKRTNLKVSLKTAAYQALGDFPLSVNIPNPSVLWQQKLGNKLSGSLSGEWVHSDGHYKCRFKKVNPADHSVAYDTTIIRGNGNINAFRLEGGLYGTLNGSEWKLKTYYYNSERGLPGAVVENVFVRYGDHLWDKNFFTQGSFRKVLFSKVDLLVNAKYAYDYTHYIHNDMLIVESGSYDDNMHYNNTYIQQEVYGSTAVRYVPFTWWNTVLSVDYQWNKLDADLKEFAYPQRNTVLVATATDFHWERLKIQANLLGTFVRETVTIKTAAPPKNICSPTVIASYRLLKKQDLFLRAFYKNIFRMPTFNDLYYTMIGNSVLKPEYTTQYNIGVLYSRAFDQGVFRRMGIQVDAYHNEVKDKIIASPTGSQFRWQMENLGLVEIRGMDVSANATILLSKDFQADARLTYTYQKAQDFTNPTDSYYENQIPYIPQHSGSAILALTYESWELNYSFIYTGERYDMKANIPENYQQPWYTSDVSVAVNLDIKRTKLKISAEINNLFNQYYDVVINYPMPGQNYRLMVALQM
jgi:outer membrane cobalamin receptor